MTSFSFNPIVSSKFDEAPLIEKILDRIEEKLQALLTKVGKRNIELKEDNEIITRDELENLSYQQEQTTVSLKEKSTRILYQIEVLQILLAEKNLPQKSTNSKAFDLGVKKSFESTESKKHLESYLKTSFSGKERHKNEALKQIMLTLCNESELQLKSRIFLKAEIQDHFSKVYTADQMSVEKQKNQTQQYLEKFISQIGELREKIQTLQEQNQVLLKENVEISQKLLAKKEQNYFLNPELISDKFHAKSYKNINLENCQFCFRLTEDNKFLEFQFKKMEEFLTTKENTIEEMNEEYSREILKYNKVFKTLSNENDELRRYINEDLANFIQSLQNQIFQLKSAERYKKFEIQERKKLADFLDQQNQYYYVNPKFENNEFLRNPIQEHLNQNAFSKRIIKNNLPQASRSRIVMQIPQKSKNKHSRQSLKSRPHSYKSHSPNFEIKKTLEKRYANQNFERQVFKRFERD